MTNESAASPMTLDPLSSRSLAEFAAHSEVTPQRGATALDAARHHAFTGEITFVVDPLVRVYLDGGVVYFAEIESSRSIGDLLVASGAVTRAQFDAAVVRVGDVEHLGRLFDRDESIDRDATMVVVEHHVGELVNQIAEQVVSTISISAYRHHPSGVHRWFVAPVDAPASARPVSEVAQIDRTVVDEIPGLEPAPELRIEWNEPLDSVTPSPVEAELDHFDADVADWAAEAAVVEPVGDDLGTSTSDTTIPDATPSDGVASAIDDFRIIWPDGSAHGTTASDEAETADADNDSDNDSDIDDPASGHPATPSVSLELTPAVVDELPAPDAAIPDDVAAAVRRALNAIDEASSQPIVIPEMELSPILLPQIEIEPADESSTVAEPVAPPASAEPVAPVSSAPVANGFAPPTADMRAEVMYQRQAEEAAARSTDVAAPAEPHTQPGADATAATAETSAASTIETPVLPPAKVEPAPEPETNSRRGALRRLIGSLRRDDD